MKDTIDLALRCHTCGALTPTKEAVVALFELLSQPDPPEMVGKRKYRYTLPGDPLRREEIKRNLCLHYIRHRMSGAGKEEGTIVSLRRFPLDEKR